MLLDTKIQISISNDGESNTVSIDGIAEYTPNEVLTTLELAKNAVTNSFRVLMGKEDFSEDEFQILFNTKLIDLYAAQENQ